MHNLLDQVRFLAPQPDTMRYLAPLGVRYISMVAQTGTVWYLSVAHLQFSWCYTFFNAILLRVYSSQQGKKFHLYWLFRKY